MRERHREMVRFGITGCIAVGIQYVTYVAALRVLPVGVSFALSYLFSFLANYLLTTGFTFAGTHKSWRNGVGFAACHVLNFCLQMVCLRAFVGAGIPKQWALLAVLAVCVPVNFVFVRHVMKKR